MSKARCELEAQALHRHTTVHRTVGGGNGTIIVSAVPAHVFLPDCVSRNCCPRDYWKSPASSGTFPIETPLIGFSSFPDSVTGKEISLSAESDQGAALDLQAFEKA